MNVGRPLQFDPNQVLYSALKVFWQYGYESTSLQDLLSSMGLSKSSFYQAFGNKQQLFELCIQRYREDTLHEIRTALEECDEAWALIRALFMNTIAESEGKEYHWGCLVMNTASEFAQRDLSVAKQVTQTTSAFMELFGEIVSLGQEQGQISNNKSPIQLARYLLSSLSGLHTMLKAGTKREQAEELVDVIMEALK